jgi:hypothetical protein
VEGYWTTGISETFVMILFEEYLGRLDEGRVGSDIP